MSGAEAIAVVGLISAVIDIMQAAKDIVEIASSAHGLPEYMRNASAMVDSFLVTLGEAKVFQEQSYARLSRSNNADIEDAKKRSRVVTVIMVHCRQNAEILKNLFQKTCPPNPSSLRKYFAACQAVIFSKKRMVNELLLDTKDQLEQLHQQESFRSMTTLDQLKEACDKYLALQNTSLPHQVESQGTNVAIVTQQDRTHSSRAESSDRSNMPKSNAQIWNAAQYNISNMAGSKVNNQGHIVVYGGQTVSM